MARSKASMQKGSERRYEKESTVGRNGISRVYSFAVYSTKNDIITKLFSLEMKIFCAAFIAARVKCGAVVIIIIFIRS
jgi:hypothetical protein